jgi:hypothetical protein
LHKHYTTDKLQNKQYDPCVKKYWTETGAVTN